MNNELRKLKEITEPGVEFAMYVKAGSECAQLPEGFSRIYFGSEFCELSFPSKKEIFSVLEYCNETQKDFTLVTPAVTDSSLRKILGIVKDISRKQKVEIVVNDFGALHELKNFKNIKLAAGRLLIRQKSDPRLSALKSASMKKHFEKTAVDNSIYAELLQQSGIERIELDNSAAGFVAPCAFSVSMYWPYVFLTLSPGCYGRKCDDCGTEVRLSCNEVDMPLLQAGNAIYYENKNVKKAQLARIDRIVAQQGLSR